MNHLTKIFLELVFGLLAIALMIKGLIVVWFYSKIIAITLFVFAAPVLAIIGLIKLF